MQKKKKTVNKIYTGKYPPNNIKIKCCVREFHPPQSQGHKIMSKFQEVSYLMISEEKQPTLPLYN